MWLIKPKNLPIFFFSSWCDLSNDWGGFEDSSQPTAIMPLNHQGKIVIVTIPITVCTKSCFSICQQRLSCDLTVWWQIMCPDNQGIYNGRRLTQIACVVLQINTWVICHTSYSLPAIQVTLCKLTLLGHVARSIGIFGNSQQSFWKVLVCAALLQNYIIKMPSSSLQNW